MTPVIEVEELRRQNALLLKRLLVISRERDRLAALVAVLPPHAPSERAS